MLIAALILPLLLASQSPLLAWRDPVYIASGFAGIAAMSGLLIQPLLISGLLGLTPRKARRLHRGIGALLLALVLLHVAGLWITSPPDVIDALTFTSPTPFSVWGVLAMWAILLSATLAVMRKRLGLRLWRHAHLALALVIVAGTILHALLIEGTMETLSKWGLCALLILATARIFTPYLRRNS